MHWQLIIKNNRDEDDDCNAADNNGGNGDNFVVNVTNITVSDN